jgi:2-dehydropantoate 2-reductase
VYVVGSGAVGMALAACIAAHGRKAIAVRTRDRRAPGKTVRVSLHHGEDRLTVPVETVGLSLLPGLDGILAITAKSYANKAIALELGKMAVRGPLVIMQNGVGVERPFLEEQFQEIYRCVLYLTSQGTGDNEFGFHSIKSSPIGMVAGTEAGLESVVKALSTEAFPFRAERDIQREIWKKAIINAVFNSICPLLELDNGIFVRDPGVAELAKDVVTECIALTDRLELGLTPAELTEQIMHISRSSDGQLISTLQDIRNGRQTEIESMNLEMARIAAAQRPRIDLPRTELLGKMILARSNQPAKGEFFGPRPDL